MSVTARRVGSLLILISAYGVFYSGLMFLEVVPLPDIRFWEGGQYSLTAAALLDLTGGTLGFIVGIPLIFRIWRGRSGLRTQKLLRNFAGASVLGIIGDLIGGLYALAAQLGLYSSLILIASFRSERRRKGKTA